MKKLFQLVFALALLGAAFFIINKYFLEPQKNTEQLKEAASGNIKSLDVNSMVKRSFRTEQTDILDDARFRALLDNSVELRPLEEIIAGKKNPFTLKDE